MARYFLNIGTDTNSTANWSNTSGGAGGFSVPTSTDDVFFDANSGPATLTANMSVKTLTFTGYTSTITMSFNITASGSVTLDTTMTVAGAGTLFVNATATLTSNGKTWGNPMSFTNTITITLVGDLYVAGTVTTTTQTFNGSAIYCTTSLSVTGSMVAGTSNFHLNGTGTWSGAGTLRNNLLIDSTANLTISGSVYYGTGTLTIDPAATVVTTGSQLMLVSNCTLDLNNKVLNNLDKNGSTLTSTLLSNITCANLLKNSVNGVNFNGFNIYVTSSYGLPGNNGNVGGTTLVNLNGTGITWGNFGNGGYTTNSVNITAGSSVTISGTIKRNAGTLTIDPTATVTTTGSTLWIFAGTQTYNTANTVFENVYISNTVSGLTFNSKLLANTITIDTTVTFLGSYGFETPSLILSTIITGSSKTLTFKNGVEYKVTSSFVSNGTSAQKYIFTSDSGTLKALFTLAYGATQSVNYTNATRIDSSNGQTINASLASVLTDTINWQLTEGNWWLVLNRA